MARQRNSSQEKVFSKTQIKDFNDRLGVLPITQQGIINLGSAIDHLKNKRKPDWVPVSRGPDGDKSKTYVSDDEWDEEKNEPWSYDDFARIVNREYGLWKDAKISRDALNRIIQPRLNTKPPNTQLLGLIAGLHILKNPETGVPYDFVDFIAIAKEVLDWRTGEYKLPSTIGSE